MFADTDVLVVGSGPAGSTTARYLAEAGVKVTVIERRPEVGVPVRCGELVPSTEEIKGMFPNLENAEELFDMPESLKCLDIESIKLFDPKHKVYEIPFTGYTTDRDRFDKHLMDCAIKEGAELITSCSFSEASNGVAKTNLGDISYKIIVGADGPGSRTAKSLGLPGNRNPYPAVTSQAKGDFEPSVQMFFGSVAPSAYGWIIPKKGCANIGVGFNQKFAKGTPMEYLEKFVSLNGLQPYGKPEGKYVPSEGPVAKTYSHNGMIVGDQAGFVISVNGGGIPLAMIGGRICADSALNNIRLGTPLSEYQKRWENVMGNPLRIAARNKKLADAFAFRSEFSTGFFMNFLGTKRMGKLIRCKKLYF